MTNEAGLYGHRQDGLTLGQLRQRVERWGDLPDDTPVCIERIEDVYFEKHGWSTFDQQLAGMADAESFFQAWGCLSHDGKILIKAHY